MTSYPEPKTGKKPVKPTTRKGDKKRRVRWRRLVNGEYRLLRHATPEQLAKVWRGKLDVFQLWWCSSCCCVFRAGDIHLYDDLAAPGSNLFTVCPYCSSCTFWWWHGWPSMVIEKWTAWPKSGTRYHLPQDWVEEERDEPGIIAAAGSPSERNSIS